MPKLSHAWKVLPLPVGLSIVPKNPIPLLLVMLFRLVLSELLRLIPGPKTTPKVTLFRLALFEEPIKIPADPDTVMSVRLALSESDRPITKPGTFVAGPPVATTLLRLALSELVKEITGDIPSEVVTTTLIRLALLELDRIIPVELVITLILLRLTLSEFTPRMPKNPAALCNIEFWKMVRRLPLDYFVTTRPLLF